MSTFDTPMRWADYPNFTEAEFRCKATGHCRMHPEFMERLQKLRTAFGRPMRITSGYRDRAHPVEKSKASPGAHTMGRACDVSLQGSEALRLVTMAVAHGFTGIGIQQHGSVRFIHLDDLQPGSGFPRPTIWSYP